MERDVLDDAVALVEDAEDRDPLGHGRHAALPGRGRRDLLAALHRILLLIAAPAGGKREGHQDRSGKLHRAYSGIHGS
jgi:hypothetical protein